MKNSLTNLLITEVTPRFRFFSTELNIHQSCIEIEAGGSLCATSVPCSSSQYVQYHLCYLDFWIPVTFSLRHSL